MRKKLSSSIMTGTDHNNIRKRKGEISRKKMEKESMLNPSTCSSIISIKKTNCSREGATTETEAVHMWEYNMHIVKLGISTLQPMILLPQGIDPPKNHETLHVPSQ